MRKNSFANKKMDELYLRARKLSDIEKIKALQLLEDESKDLIFFPDYWKEIIKDAENGIKSFEDNKS